MEASSGPTGFLLVDKPRGITSRDCVNQLQRLLPKRTKIGHAGTLDTFATGLLVIGIGRVATKQFKHLIMLDKVYQVSAKLGQLTDTFDHTGTSIRDYIDKPVSLQQVQDVVHNFEKKYEQVPPAFSALKWRGRRLSDRARSLTADTYELDHIVAMKKRTVHIYDLVLVDYVLPYMKLQAHVSHGTYIRVLVNDIAKQCGTVATAHDLRRMTVGPFHIDQAVPLHSLVSLEAICVSLMSVDEVSSKYDLGEK